MCRLDGSVAASDALCRLQFGNVGGKLGCEPAKARVLRLKSGQFGGKPGFGRFAINHADHPGRRIPTVRG